jgi:hypothetical protein
MKKNFIILILGLFLSGAIGGLVGYEQGYAQKVEDIAPVQQPAYLSVMGETIPVFPGDDVDIEISDTREGAVNIYANRGETTPARLLSNVDAFASSFQMSAPEIELNGSKVSGGEMIYTVKGLATKGNIVLLFIGGLAVIGGIITALKWDVKMGVGVAVGGVALIVISVMFSAYPWLALLIPLLGVGALAYYWYRNKKAADQNKALTGIVKAVERTNGDALVVKEEIKKENEISGGTIKKVISPIKAKINEPS